MEQELQNVLCKQELSGGLKPTFIIRIGWRLFMGVCLITQFAWEKTSVGNLTCETATWIIVERFRVGLNFRWLLYKWVILCISGFKGILMERLMTSEKKLYIYGCKSHLREVFDWLLYMNGFPQASRAPRAQWCMRAYFWSQRHANQNENLKKIKRKTYYRILHISKNSWACIW